MQSTKQFISQTSYSGEYQLLDNDVTIHDIDHLPESMQRAIIFMVSKGYFIVTEDGYFFGEKIVSRENFAKALVRIFFALDRNLTSSFSDVDRSIDYHDYIASAEQREIILGYDDGTFRGAQPVTREKVNGLASRTLIDQRNYHLPDKLEDYLLFHDAEEIAGVHNEEVALAVQVGLIEKSGKLIPKKEIMRQETADILYGLFMLLYDVPPAALSCNVDLIDLVEEDLDRSSDLSVGNTLAFIWSHYSLPEPLMEPFISEENMVQLMYKSQFQGTTD